MQFSKTELGYFIILLGCLSAVFVLNWVAGGTITSPRHLATDLASPPDSPQDWVVQYWIPTKYRVLYRWIVQGTFALLFSPSDAFGFYLAFAFWGFVFFFCTLIALFYYLRALEFDQRMAFIGCLLFLALPPVTLAYKYPVYTREDPLAYFLVLLGLIALFKHKPIWVSFFSSLAAITRETTLILPLTYFLAARDSWRNKILICLPPVIAAIGIRLLLGYANYNPFEGSIYNFEMPWQTLAFVFCIFGVVWLPYLIQLHDQWRAGNHSSYAWHVLVTTAPIILLLVFGTHIVLARAREVRISFLLFPWALPLALAWFSANRACWQSLAAQRAYRIFALTLFAGLTLVILYGSLTNPELMRQYLADFKNGYWLVISDIHLSATLAVVLPTLFLRWCEDHPSILLSPRNAGGLKVF